jgi:hypothetical protein
VAEQDDEWAGVRRAEAGDGVADLVDFAGDVSCETPFEDDLGDGGFLAGGAGGVDEGVEEGDGRGVGEVGWGRGRMKRGKAQAGRLCHEVRKGSVAG